MKYSNVIKEKRILCCVIATTLLLFASCHQNMELKGSGGSLIITVENFSSAAAKTIAPGQLTVGNLQNQYQLKISGTTGRMTLPEQVITLTNGRAILPNLSSGLWQLTLSAYNASGAVRILEGMATVEVRSVGVNEVSFVLRPVATGTGTMNVTIRLNAQDMAIFNSGGTINRTLKVGIRHLDGSTVAGTADLGGTSTGTVNSQTLTYKGTAGNNSANIPAGEYMLEYIMSGGGISAGTTVRWSDNLYIEPGRETSGTITLPQLINKPAKPEFFFCHSKSYQNTYDTELLWEPVYNADSYEIQVKRFTGGSWATPSENAWNSLTGSTQFEYKSSSWSTVNGAPIYTGGGGLGKRDDSFTLRVSRNANQHFVARIRSVNACGFSDWLYLPTLMNPSPTIINISTAGVANNQRAVNVIIGNVDYETRYEMEFYNLRGTAANLFNIINDNDDEWENYRPANTGNIGSFPVYKSSGSYWYNDSQATPTIVFQPFNRNNNLCFRIRAVVQLGGGTSYSPWAYYTQSVNTGP